MKENNIESGWNSGGVSVTPEELKYIMQHIIGFTVKFEQYSSNFRGQVTECDGEMVKMTLAKDSSIFPNFIGRCSCQLLASVDFKKHSIEMLPGAIASMQRMKKN